MSRGISIGLICILTLLGCAEDIQEIPHDKLKTISFAQSIEFERPIVVTSYKVKNIGDTPIFSPRVIAKNQPHLFSLRELAKDVEANDQMTTAINAWNLMKSYQGHFCSAGLGDSWATDPLEILSIYGFSCCDQSARALSVLFDSLNIKNRIVSYPEHTVIEAFIDGHWRMFDPDHGVYYQDAEMNIVGVEELKNNPELINYDPTPVSLAEMQQIYSQDPEFSDFGMYVGVANSYLDFQLNPGDSLYFSDRPPSDSALRYTRLPIYAFDVPPSFDEVPYVYGRVRKNGKLDQPIKVNWPFPISDGELQLTGCAGAEVQVVSTHSDGSSRVLNALLDLRASLSLEDLILPDEGIPIESFEVQSSIPNCSNDVTARFAFVAPYSILNSFEPTNKISYLDENGSKKRHLRVSVNENISQTIESGTGSPTQPRTISLDLSALPPSPTTANWTLSKESDETANLWLRGAKGVHKVQVQIDNVKYVREFTHGESEKLGRISNTISLPETRGRTNFSLSLEAFPNASLEINNVLIELGN